MALLFHHQAPIKGSPLTMLGLKLLVMFSN